MPCQIAERLAGGRYVDVDIRRKATARYGLNIADVQRVIQSAVGGINVGETVEGLQRFPINVRYPREIRDSLAALRSMPIVTVRGQQLVLADVADIRVSDGRPMVLSENSRPAGFVYVDVRDRDRVRRWRTCSAGWRSRWRCHRATPCPGPDSSSIWSGPPPS